MQLGEISQDLRRELWNVVRAVLLSKRTDTGGFGYYFQDESRWTIERILGRILKTPEDEIETDYSDVMQTFKTRILTAEFNGVLDVVEVFIDEDSRHNL